MYSCVSTSRHALHPQTAKGSLSDHISTERMVSHSAGKIQEWMPFVAQLEMGVLALPFTFTTYLGLSEFMVYLVRVYLGSLPNPSHLWVAATLPAQLRTRSALVEHMQGTMLARA